MKDSEKNSIIGETEFFIVQDECNPIVSNPAAVTGSAGELLRVPAVQEAEYGQLQHEQAHRVHAQQGAHRPSCFHR